MSRILFYAFLGAIGADSAVNYGSYGPAQNAYYGSPHSNPATGFYPPTSDFCGACPTGSYRESNGNSGHCGRCVISPGAGECHNYECSPQYPCPQRCRPRTCQPNCPPHPRIQCPYIPPVQCPTNIPCSDHTPRNCTSSFTLCPPLPSIHVPQVYCPPHPVIQCPHPGHLQCPNINCPVPQPIKCPQVQCPQPSHSQCPIHQTPQCPHVTCPKESLVCPPGPSHTNPDCPTIKLPAIICPTQGPVSCPPHPQVRCPRVSCPSPRVNCQQDCPPEVVQECNINAPINCPSTCRAF